MISVTEASDGTEFFDEDDWTDTDFTHFETSFGGLALRPGNNEVLYTRMDPIDGAAIGENDFSAGLHWSSLTDGSENQAYELYDPDTPGLTGIFGKGNGLGDVELICEAPPLEVGNRVWCDDGDGVQDPGEPGLASVPVTFTCDTGGDGLVGNGGDLTATTTTDASGLFLFNAANVTGGIPPRTQCQIRVSRAPLNGVCGAIADVTLADASSGTGEDLRDSDAQILFGDIVGIEFTTGALGESDHSLDIGFTPATTVDVAGNLEIVKTSDPSGPVSPGDTITYSIEVTNPSGITHTGIEVFAEPPPGLSYVAQSTVASGPRSFFVLDRFETSSFSNQDGRNDWSTDWIETDGGGAGPGAGNVLVTGGALSLDDLPDTGGQPGVEREVDLSGLTAATLE
ncbi:MAG: SdrD B-like domain-containing protein, partial [Acidobacteriota bacterium]